MLEGSATPLEGAELLKKVKQMKDSPKSEVARACGFVSQTKDGAERVNFTAFYDALLVAKGIEVGRQKSPGRALTYKAKLQGDGKLIVGSAYTRKMNLDPNTVFTIEVGQTKVTLTASPQPEAPPLVESVN